MSCYVPPDETPGIFGVPAVCVMCVWIILLDCLFAPFVRCLNEEGQEGGSDRSLEEAAWGGGPCDF